MSKEERKEKDLDQGEEERVGLSRRELSEWIEIRWKDEKATKDGRAGEEAKGNEAHNGEGRGKVRRIA